MKRILYLMHIPWGWIKQRPHFFAEYLSREYRIDVCYRRSNTVSKKKLLTAKASLSNMSVKGFNNIPFEKIPVWKYFNCNWINSIIAFFQLPSVKQYDYVWLTSPILYPVIKPLLRKQQKVIYDCMDDMIEFPDAKVNRILRNAILSNEKKLLKNADYVFVSSEYLKEKILSRAGVNSDRIYIINNAIELPSTDNPIACPTEIKEKIEYVKSLSHTFMYVGMVSEWFDFDLILEALNRYQNINFVLVGPNDVVIPQHERIHYLGTVERKYIFPLMKEACALIMPFMLNELIRSVNPVKLYEYIYTGKPVISIRYGETEKFKDFVHLYKTAEDFFAIMESYLDGCLVAKRREDIDRFISENTWKARYKQITKVLQS